MQDVNTLLFNNSTCDEETISKTVIDMQIKGIDTFARLTNSTAFVIDFDRHKMLYRTDRMLFLDQISYNDYQRECENPYWGLVTEDTLNYLLLLRKNYPLLHQAMDAEEKRNVLWLMRAYVHEKIPILSASESYRHETRNRRIIMRLHYLGLSSVAALILKIR